MSKEKFITPILGIESAAQYWMEIVQPNFLRFNSEPTAREAFNLCSSLWHLIDWVEKDFRTNPNRLSLGDLRNQFEIKCSALSALHDIATNSKHGGVSRPRSSIVSTKAIIDSVNFYFGSSGSISEHSANYIIELSNGDQVMLHKLVEGAYLFWSNYFKPK